MFRNQHFITFVQVVGLDNGPMLYHAMSNIKTNPFEYTMSTIKSAFHSIAERIKDNSIFKINPEVQDKSKEIRYSKKNEFNEEIVKEYFEKEINLNNKKLDNSLLKEPFFLDNLTLLSVIDASASITVKSCFSTSLKLH